MRLSDPSVVRSVWEEVLFLHPPLLGLIICNVQMCRCDIFFQYLNLIRMLSDPKKALIHERSDLLIGLGA